MISLLAEKCKPSLSSMIFQLAILEFVNDEFGYFMMLAKTLQTAKLHQQVPLVRIVTSDYST